MKWYDSTPISLVGCTLCSLLVYFIGELNIPTAVHTGLLMTFAAAVIAHSATDFKRKFPDYNSKIGYSILFVLFAFAYAMTEIAL